MKLKIRKEVFNPHFFQYLNDEHFVQLFVGGGGSGKSANNYLRCVYRCLIDTRKYLIVRKSAVDVERSCWADIMWVLDRFKIRDRVKINKTMRTIDFPNGSQILMMGLDDEAKLKSIPNITDIIIEEASDINFDGYCQLKMRVRGRGKLKNQVVLLTNPISKANWIYKFFFETGCKEKDCLIDRSTYKDNPHLNEETIKTLEGYKDTNPYYYKVYCLGEWGQISKQVYSNWRIEDLPIADLMKSGFVVGTGLDWGFSADETALILFLLDEENKKIYVINELYEKGLTNPDIAKRIELMGLMKSTIIADSAEPKSIEELKRLGVRRIKSATKGPDSIRQGIQRLQQYEIIVDSSCVHTIEELENYCYKKDKSTGEYLNEPIDDFNHLMDAMRYGIQCADVAKAKSVNKASLNLGL